MLSGDNDGQMSTKFGRSSSTADNGSEDETGMIDLQKASDANLVVAIARWHEPAMAEAYRRHGGADPCVGPPHSFVTIPRLKRSPKMCS